MMGGRSIGRVLLVVICWANMNSSAAEGRGGLTNAALGEVVAAAVSGARGQFPKLKEDQIAVTLVEMSGPLRPVGASYRGAVGIYPASVIKLFYLAAAHAWMEDGRVAETAELRRALSDMIVHSSNDATHYVIDVLTGTTSGPELPDEELTVWQEKRNAVNRHFAGLGYTGINVNKKPWGDGPYGRETQAMRAFQPNRNLLTTEAAARLLVEMVAGRCVTAERSAAMMALLKRDPFDAKRSDPDDQAKFTGVALPPGAKLWSKAGWTSRTRHDAAYVELADGRKFALVVFTEGHANERGIIPAVARGVMERLQSGGAVPVPPR